MAKGRWKTKPVTLSLEKLKALLKADQKRKRQTYDSCQLVLGRLSESGLAWDYEELIIEPENLVGYPKASYAS